MEQGSWIHAGLVGGWVRDLPSARFHEPTSSHLFHLSSPVPPSYKNFNLESFSHQRKNHHYAMEAIIIILERHGSIHGHCKCRRHNRLPFLAALAAAFYYFVMPSLLEPGGRSKMSQARAKTSDGEARRMKASSLVTTRRNQSAHPIVTRSCHVHCSIHPHKSLASSSRMLGFAWL